MKTKPDSHSPAANFGCAVVHLSGISTKTTTTG
jgi:hypothetical protein